MMKISKRRLKEIIREELAALEEEEIGTGTVLARRHRDPETGKLTLIPYGRTKSAKTTPEPAKVAAPLTSTLRDLDLERRIRAYIKKMEAQGEPLSIAGTTNPWEQSDEPEELKTLEMTPEEFEEFRRG